VGYQPLEYFGTSIAALPDLDGDGVSDYVVGGPYATPRPWETPSKPTRSLESRQRQAGPAPWPEPSLRV
jgi:hypothetical protein